MKRILALMLLTATASVHAQGLMKSVGGGGGGDNPEAKAALPAFDDDNKYMFYVGADLQNSKLSVSDSGRFGGIDNTSYDSKFWDARVGYRLFKAIGIEAHYGFPDEDAKTPGRYKKRNYYGFFAVPTANVFDLFEIAFPLGYTNSGITVDGNNSSAGTSTVVKKHLNSLAYGANLEVPIRVFWRALPDFRITGGGMVYYQRSDAREYGFHFGLRYDFGFGTPSGG